MNKSRNKNNLTKRRLVYLFLALFGLIVGGYYGWNYLADTLETELNKQIEKLAQRGKTLKCANQRVEGFPFRVGVFCDEVHFDDSSRKILFKAGNVRSAAQFYQPGFIVGEIDSPALLNLPNSGQIDLNWELAQSSTRLSLDGIRRISLNLKNFIARGLENNRQQLPDIQLASAGLHFRAAGGDVSSSDGDIAVDLNDIKISNRSQALFPNTDLKADGVVFGLNQVLKSRQDLGRWIRSSGLKIQLRKMELGFAEGGQFLASGPIQFNPRGIMSGELDVEISGIRELVEVFSDYIPNLAENAKLIEAASIFLSQNSNNKALQLKLDIKDGKVSAGFIQLGTIPPLFRH